MYTHTTYTHATTQHVYVSIHMQTTCTCMHMHAHTQHMMCTCTHTTYTCMHTLHSHTGEENYSRAVRLFVFPLEPFPFQRASDGREVCKQCWHDPLTHSWTLVSVPDPKLTPAWIAFSIAHGELKVSMCGMRSGDETSRTQVRRSLKMRQGWLTPSISS